MNLENVIKEHVMQLKSTRRQIDIAPDIPAEMLEKWTKKYSNVIGSELSEFILAISNTKTGSFALTGDTMYYDNFLQGGLKVLKYTDISNISIKPGSMFITEKIYVQLKNGEELCLDGCIDGISIGKFAEIFVYIIKCAEEQALTLSKQNISLYELSDELKELYLKVLCNYSCIDNSIINANEHNAISSFSIRMEIGSATRKNLNSYMTAIVDRQKTGALIKDIKLKVQNESGQWDAIRYSLMQDILYIHNLNGVSQPWQEDGFIGSLMQTLNLKPPQIATMLCAIDLNNKMLKKNADFKLLKKEWMLFTKKIRYSESYVPTIGLFCSGSIYGITSYTEFMKKDETSEKAINKQRELILQEIITNNQKTINVLIDDLNFIAEKLEDEIKKGKMNQDNSEAFFNRLRALSKTNSLQKDKEQELEEIKRRDESAEEY